MSTYWFDFTKEKIQQMKLSYSSMRGARGMHFLTNYDIAYSIVKASGVTADDHVLEIGGGLGILTLALLDVTPQVTVIEQDAFLFEHLKKTFGTRIKLIHGDALKVSWPSDVKLVSNLPYFIGIQVLQKAFHHSVHSMIVMLQEEVVDKITSKPCSATYGSLTVFFQLHSNVRKCFNVSPDNFLPSPKVISSILSVIPKVKPVDLRNLELLARNLFFTRNRTVRKVVKGYIKRRASKEAIMNIPHGEKRVRCIDLEELRAILNFLTSHNLWPLAV